MSRNCLDELEDGSVLDAAVLVEYLVVVAEDNVSVLQLDVFLVQVVAEHHLLLVESLLFHLLDHLFDGGLVLLDAFGLGLLLDDGQLLRARPVDLLLFDPLGE